MTSSPSCTSSVRLLLLATAVTAAVGAVSTPAVHGQALVLLAPQAADADYIHRIDAINATMVTTAALGGYSSTASAPTHTLLADQEATLDRLWATGQVPDGFRASHTALRIAITVLDQRDQAPSTPDPAIDTTEAAYQRAAADFTRDYQAALHAAGLPASAGP